MTLDPTPYDAVAYPTFANPESHPDRMAAIAILHGLRPAPVERCRVLEIACNDGGNLIPMAYGLPHSEFVGFDLAPSPIQRGQKRVDSLGLTNIQLFAGNLMNVGPELGRFDYIVAHGLYSWIPDAVRDRLMALCGELLNENGIAYVSYEALPGAYVRLLTRDIMKLGTKQIMNPEERVAQARALLKAVQAARPEGELYWKVIQTQLESMEKRGVEPVFHDELGDEYHPVLFSQFAAHAGRHGLQYLSDAMLPPANDPGTQPAFEGVLNQLLSGDELEREQMRDFARMRPFRETLLCRSGSVVHRQPDAEDLEQLLVATQCKSSPGRAAGRRVYTAPGGARLETDHVGVIALMNALETANPHAVSLKELAPHIAMGGLALDQEGIGTLMQLVAARLIAFHAWNAPMARQIAGQPQASKAARQEAETLPAVTTLTHLKFVLKDPAIVQLLPLLDGARDRAALLDALMSAAAGMPQDEVELVLDRNLALLYRSGLLEA